MMDVSRFVGVTALSGVLGLAPCVVEAAEADPRQASAPASPVADQDEAADQQQPRRLLIAGASVAGAGLLMMASGFGALGGMHAANPGPGWSLQSDDPDHLHRTLRLAKGMEALAWSGVALTALGSVLLTVGAVRLHRARRLFDSRVAVGLGPRSVSMSIRF